MKSTYKRPLSRTILVGCAVFCIFLCFIMGALGAVNYYRGMMDRYESYMEGILRYALTQIDGDDLGAAWKRARNRCNTKKPSRCWTESRKPMRSNTSTL